MSLVPYGLGLYQSIVHMVVSNSWTWSMPLVLLILVAMRVRLYTIKDDKKKIDTILYNINRSCISTIVVYEKGNFSPSGFVIGKCLIGMICGEGKSSTVYILTCKSVMISLMIEASTNVDKDDVIETDTAKPGTVCFWERQGSFFDLYYENRMVDCNKFLPRGNQQKIIDSIVSMYKLLKSFTTYIYGKPGTGKSTIPIMVALALNATVCMDLCPTDPGDTIAKLIQRVKPTRARPLIILLDEADCMIMKIHNNKIGMHKNIPTQVYDKATFNKFLDYIDKFTTNVIVIMTSNRSKAFIDELDASYLRKNRVHAVFEL